jgi:hypothetical protein
MKKTIESTDSGVACGEAVISKRKMLFFEKDGTVTGRTG